MDRATTGRILLRLVVMNAKALPRAARPIPPARMRSRRPDLSTGALAGTDITRLAGGDRTDHEKGTALFSVLDPCVDQEESARGGELFMGRGIFYSEAEIELPPVENDAAGFEYTPF